MGYPYYFQHNFFLAQDNFKEIDYTNPKIIFKLSFFKVKGINVTFKTLKVFFELSIKNLYIYTDS